jgi:chromosome segregation ATPase
MGRDARHEDETQDARRETCLVSRQDVFDELLENTRRTASLEVLQEKLNSASELLTRTEAELAATREEVQFLRERLEEKDAVISRLSEAQVEALRRRDILDAQERNALPKPVASRAWWRFWR